MKLIFGWLIFGPLLAGATLLGAGRHLGVRGSLQLGALLGLGQLGVLGALFGIFGNAGGSLVGRLNYGL